MSVVVMPASGNRLRGIEGLRGLAAFAILCFHIMLVLRAPGQVRTALDPFSGLFAHSLTMFFVLSGFLLYRPYVRGVLDGRPIPRTGAYFRNRVLRIWPIYIVVLVVVGFVLGLARVNATYSGSMESQSHELGRFTDPWLFLTNLLLIQGWVPDHMFTGLVVSWSLGTEVGFYLLVPLFGFIAVRLARSGPGVLAVLVPPAILMAVGLTTRLTILQSVAAADPADRAEIISGTTWSAVFYRSVLGQGDLLAAGMTAAVVVVALSSSSRRGARPTAWVLAFIAAMGVVLVGGGELAIPFVGLFCAAGVALLQLPRGGWLPRIGIHFLESLPIRAAGLCSYSVYLWHCSVIWLLRLHVEGFRYATAAELISCIVIVALFTYPLSWFTYRWVELPFMERKHRVPGVAPAEDATPTDEAGVTPVSIESARRRRVAAAAAVAVVAVSGTSVAAAQGRLPAPAQELAATTGNLVLPERLALPYPDLSHHAPAPGPSTAPLPQTSSSPSTPDDPSAAGTTSGKPAGGNQQDGHRPPATNPDELDDRSPIKVPPVKVPPVKVPPVEAPPVEVPPIDAPPVEVPELPGVNSQRIQPPRIQAPAKLPEVELPELDVPTIAARSAGS